jgi:hypothetical protein
MVSTFMMFEAIIEQRDKQSQRCMVIIIPQSLSEDKDLMVDVETRVHDILSTNVLQLNILGGRVGLQTNSAFARNPHRYEVVECGASIGPAGKEWSGSFGGYLMDESTGDIYGLTCAHNLCRFDCNDNGISKEQLVELLPPGTRILQPSPYDKQHLVRSHDDAIKATQDRLAKVLARMDRDDPPPYRVLELQQSLQQLQDQKVEMTNSNDEFAISTGYAELFIDEGTLYDYVLLKITMRLWPCKNTWTM